MNHCGSRLMLLFLLAFAFASRAAAVTTTWLGGTGNWSDAGKWSTGVPASSTTDPVLAVIDDAPATSSLVTVDSPVSTNTLRVDSGNQLNVTSTGELDVDGLTLQNSGIVSLGGSLVANPGAGGTTTLSGGGRINLSGGSLGSSGGLANVDNVIVGFGSVGFGSFDNRGSIASKTAGKSLAFSTGFSNEGTLEATDGGTIDLSLPGMTNAGGTILALRGGIIDLGDSMTSTGGAFSALVNSSLDLRGTYTNTTFTTDNTSIIRIGPSTTLTINGGGFNGNVQLLDPALSGSFSNSGSMQGSLHSAGSVSIANSGNITIDGAWNAAQGTTFAQNFQSSLNPPVGTVILAGTPSAPATITKLTNVDNAITGAGMVDLVDNRDEGSITATTGTLTVTGRTSPVVPPQIYFAGNFGATSGGVLELGASGVVGGLHADGGAIHLTGNIDSEGFEVTHGGSLTVDSTLTTTNLSLVDETSSLDVNGIVRMAGDFRIYGSTQGRWTFAPTSSLDLSNAGEHGGVFFALRYEVAGADLGQVAAGFSNDNYYLPNLVIEPDGRVDLFDVFDNGNRIGGKREALYVDTLTFADATGLIGLNGIDLYYNHLIGSPDQILPGKLVPEPAIGALLGAGLLALLASARRAPG